MNQRFFVQYHYLVEERDIPKLSGEWNMRIRNTIETKLTLHPEIFGKPLRHSLANLRKLRVGDYRVIFSVGGSVVEVWAIGHRRNIYAILEKRLVNFSGE